MYIPNRDSFTFFVITMLIKIKKKNSNTIFYLSAFFPKKTPFVIPSYEKNHLLEGS